MAARGGFARSQRKTVKGLRLIAQNLDRTHGEGFNMHGSVEALLLAAIRGATTRGS